jgi:hypothetical protein
MPRRITLVIFPRVVSPDTVPPRSNQNDVNSSNSSTNITTNLGSTFSIYG